MNIKKELNKNNFNFRKLTESLNDEEINDILQEHNGSIDMQCECCGTHYFFNKETISRLKQG